MSTLALRGAELLRNGRASVVAPYLLLVLCLVAFGAAVVAYPAVALLAPIALVWIFILPNWRNGVFALAVVLPFAGLPIFVLSTRYAPVLKDVVLVLPLYVSYALACLHTRQRLVPQGDPVLPLMAVFGTLVVAYLLLSESLLAGAIGVKVWLAYFPMYVIGHALATRFDQVVRIVRITALLAAIPVAIGLLEAYFYYRSGNFGPFMSLYGPFRDEIVREVGFGQTLPRIPSTFTSAASFYNFALIALGCSLALWWMQRRPTQGLLVAAISLGLLFSGIRRAYITAPLVLVLPVLLQRTRLHVRIQTLAIVLVLVVSLSVGGVALGGLAGRIGNLAGSEATVLIERDIVPAVTGSFAGHGTGSDTNAALRYAGSPEEVNAAQPNWKEGWYTQAFYELGIVGGVVSLILIITILWSAARVFRITDPSVRLFCIPLFAVLLVTAVLMVKASELNWDPISIYFFLIAGMLAGLGARLGSGVSEGSELGEWKGSRSTTIRSQP